MTHPNEALAIAVGATAPNFVLMNTDGVAYELAVARRPVLLIFYRGDW